MGSLVSSDPQKDNKPCSVVYPRIKNVELELAWRPVSVFNQISKDFKQSSFENAYPLNPLKHQLGLLSFLAFDLLILSNLAQVSILVCLLFKDGITLIVVSETDGDTVSCITPYAFLHFHDAVCSVKNQYIELQLAFNCIAVHSPVVSKSVN